MYDRPKEASVPKTSLIRPAALIERWLVTNGQTDRATAANTVSV